MSSSLYAAQDAQDPKTETKQNHQQSQQPKSPVDETHEAHETHELFLAVMSHELRTPLNSIIGMARLLQDSSQTKNLTDKQKQQLDVIYKCSFNMMELMNDVLDYSLMKMNQVKLHLSRFSVCELIETAMDIVSVKAQNKGLQLKYDLEMGRSYSSCQPNLHPSNNLTNLTNQSVDSSVIFADYKRIKQILINLLTNAIKFTPADGFISILFRLEPDTQGGLKPNQYRLFGQVQDTGIGIPRALQLRIFDDFFQVKTSKKKTEGERDGVGLGLSICRKLVELMNGKIYVLQSELNRGTTIGFDIPVFAGFSDSFIDYTKGKKILLVDENISTRFAVHEMLTQLETNPIHCNNLPDAIRLLQQYPHLVELIFCCPTNFSSNKTTNETKDQTNKTKFSNNQESSILSQIQKQVSWFEPHQLLCLVEWPTHAFQLLEGWHDHWIKYQDKLGQGAGMSLVKTHYNSLQKTAEDLNILIVEDNQYNQQTLVQILLHLKYSSHLIDVSSNGIEAAQKMKSHHYDVIFMDLKLPGWDGLETTKQIRQVCVEQNKLQPLIIAVTAYVSNVQQKQCIESGMNGYLKKPILLEQLFQVMNLIHQRKKIPELPGFLLQPFIPL